MSNPSNGIVVQRIEPILVSGDKPLAPTSATEIYRYECNVDKHCWVAYFGSNPNSAANEAFTAALVGPPVTKWRIHRGWMFVQGDHPVGQAGHVTAGSTDSAMLLQHEGDPTAGDAYVYFLRRNCYGAAIEIEIPGVTKTLDEVGQFVATTPTGLGEPATLENDPQRSQVVADIMMMLSDVGVSIKP